MTRPPRADTHAEGTLNLNSTLELGVVTLALDASTGSWRIERGTLHNGILQASAFGTVKLVNHGLIASDNSGGTLTINPTHFENMGTLRADGAGTALRILTNSFVNTGSLQELD